MNRIGWLICGLLFVLVTVFVIAADTSSSTRRVQFSNQEFAINNSGNEIVNNSNAQVNFADSNIKNTKINSNNSNINLQSSTQFNNSSVNVSNNSGYSNQSNSFDNRDYNYNNQGSYNNQSSHFQDAGPIKHKNLDDSELDAALKNAKNVPNKPIDYYNQQTEQLDKYAYKNIDWSTWKSNFVNKILDDSLSIKSLDSYNEGAWFYYSFIVDDEGRISNITVKSMYLDEADKQKVAQLIKSYQYKPITKFPPKSQRKTSKVSAVMILSGETQKAKPSDFKDLEQVKYKL